MLAFPHYIRPPVMTSRSRSSDSLSSPVRRLSMIQRASPSSSSSFIYDMLSVELFCRWWPICCRERDTARTGMLTTSCDHVHSLEPPGAADTGADSLLLPGGLGPGYVDGAEFPRAGFGCCMFARTFACAWEPRAAWAMVNVGLAGWLPASESRPSLERNEFFLTCEDPGKVPMFALAAQGELGSSPLSDLGDPSRLEDKLACEPPQAFDRRRKSAERVISSPSPDIIAS